MLNNFPLIVADESTDARIIEALRKQGFVIFSIQEMLQGIDDIDIIKLAVEKCAFIKTEDKDFGDEIVYRKADHNGAMLLRLAGITTEVKVQLTLMAIEKHSVELLNCFSVLSKKKLRIRKLR